MIIKKIIEVKSLILIAREQRTSTSPIVASVVLPISVERSIRESPGVDPRMACTRYQCKVTHEKRNVHSRLCHELHGIEYAKVTLTPILLLSMKII
jgi:hypothetical protein